VALPPARRTCSEAGTSCVVIGVVPFECAPVLIASSQPRHRREIVTRNRSEHAGTSCSFLQEVSGARWAQDHVRLKSRKDKDAILVLWLPFGYRRELLGKQTLVPTCALCSD
jgi:hypothetical protein